VNDHHSVSEQRRQLTLIVTAFGLLTLAGTVGFMVNEGWSAIDAFYMTIITVSTVGFREVHTMSPAGRVFASFVIVAGVSMAVYTFTRLGQFVLAGELLEVLGRRRMKSELEKLDGHFIVCGYGRIGQPVAEGMKRDGLPFCVVDRDAEQEVEMRSRGYICILGDATDEEVLLAAGVERAAALLALLPSDADNLYLTMTAKSMNPEVRVIARGRDERAEMKLKRGGSGRFTLSHGGRKSSERGGQADGGGVHGVGDPPSVPPAPAGGDHGHRHLGTRRSLAGRNRNPQPVRRDRGRDQKQHRGDEIQPGSGSEHRLRGYPDRHGRRARPPETRASLHRRPMTVVLTIAHRWKKVCAFEYRDGTTR